MKNKLIVALVCVDAALIGALVFWAGTPTANAQVMKGGSNYLVVSGNVSGDYDALYVLDMSRRRLLAFRFDKTKKRLLPYQGRNLERDFVRRTPVRRVP